MTSSIAQQQLVKQVLKVFQSSSVARSWADNHRSAVQDILKQAGFGFFPTPDIPEHISLRGQAEQPGPRSFFTELLSSMSDLKFSRDGRYMLARDFMTLKLWDVNMESSPVATYPIHEHLKPRVCTVSCLHGTFTLHVHIMSCLLA